MLVGLVVSAWGYFELCKSIGMFIGWNFLIGFPLASPLTFLAAHWQAKQESSLLGAAWTLLAFTAFFGSGQVAWWWKRA